MRALTAALITCVLVAPAVWAAGGRGGFDDYQHTRWSLMDGAPADIWSLMQSPDGMLWMGTGSGLYRFDGRVFARPENLRDRALYRNTTALARSRDGAIWFGYYDGGVSVLRGGTVIHYAAGPELPRGMVHAIAHDAGDRAWVATSLGLAVLANGAWQRGADWGLPAKAVHWVLSDRRSTVWVASEDGIFVLPPNAPAFRRIDVPSAGSAVLAESPDGGIWLSDEYTGLRRINPARADAGTSHPPSLRFTDQLDEVHAKRIWFTHDGAMWGTDAMHGGVFRARSTTDGSVPPPVERFDHEHGLTSDVAVPGIEDRDGNVWVGTNLGLNRLRRRSIHSPVMNADFAATEYTWCMSAENRLYVQRESRVHSVTPDGFSVVQTLPRGYKLAGIAADTLWALSPNALVRVRNGRFLESPYPERARRGQVVAFALSNGTPHLAISGQGVLRFVDGSWSKLDTGSSDWPTTLASDAGDKLWLGYADGSVRVLGNGTTAGLANVYRLDVGAITAMTVAPEGLLVAGDDGIAWRFGEDFRSMQGDRFGELLGVTGIASFDGAVWLSGLTGVISVNRAALDEAYESASASLPFRTFDAQDGLPGVAIQSEPVSTVAVVGDRLWFATNAGLAWLSPSTIQPGAQQLDSVLLALRGNGVEYTLRDTLILPAGTTHLQISFGASNLSTPRHIDYRYYLDGVDTRWQHVASGEASYSNLGPGRYRFFVSAANSDDHWSANPASVEIHIPPTLWQAPWLRVTAMLLVVALVILGYLIHGRARSERMRLRVTERYLERERIARELHDTLLQGMQGLILKLGAIVMRLAPGSAREDLDGAVLRAEGLLAESRDQVSELRSEIDPAHALEDQLVCIVDEMGLKGVTRIEIEKTGSRALADEPRAEIIRIAREAVLNACRHAGARRIMVRLDYGRTRFSLDVSDDGRGISDPLMRRSGRHGHWGISGMHERAVRIGGTFRIESDSSGTRVMLRVPARRAYSAGRHRR